MHPDVHSVLAYRENRTECDIKCCWNDTSGKDYEQIFDGYDTEATETSETVTDEQGEYSAEENDFCEIHSMLEGMTCGEDKTCYRGRCDVYNWSQIMQDHGTLRTFPKI
ncbi:uncharacterized protein LOC142564655 [Dermacentor variabilis]|uniref:uncharacterized protein LOC142564655 n=1 Tax=Dermacentor variabilis TaxID=34621 RepID=UPI003F5C2991